jgi:glutamine synthetase
MSPTEVLEYARQKGAKQLDLRFSDIPGLWHHVSYPITQFRRGLRHRRLEHPRLGGDQRERHAAHPDPATAFMDPFAESRRW